MRTVIQRVKSSNVKTEGEIKGKISYGLLLLVGLGEGDTKAEVDWQVSKILKLRIFEDEDGKMNRSVTDVEGGLLVVPQFTLYGEASKGTRPSFSKAAPPDVAESLFNYMVQQFRKQCDLTVDTGIFGAYMQVGLINDGPVTIILER